MLFKQSLAALAAAAVLGGAPAAAATFSFAIGAPNSGPGSDRIGQIQSLAFDYDDGTNNLVPGERLNASGSIEINANFGAPTGGWFVLSGGDDARQVENGLAILYMDFSSGTVVAYEYDGTLDRRGFQTYLQDDRYIATYENAVTTEVTDGIFSFEIDDLDISLIQSFSDDDAYSGVSFGDRIGVWFHLAVFNSISIGADGRVESFAPRADSYYDAVNQLATSDLNPVPLPAGALLLLTGLGGAGVLRYRRG